VSHSRGALQPPQKWIRCKQQRIYKPLTSVAGFLWQRRRPSPNEKSRPRRPMWLLSSAARWRGTCRSHANDRRCVRRAQFQLWIFSYTVWGRPSKNGMSRVMFGFRQESGALCNRCLLSKKTGDRFRCRAQFALS
jgi:hypothetical protein